MYAAIKVFPDIARSKLPVAKNFVGFCLSFMGKLGVDGARVDEQRSFGQRKIFLDGSMSVDLTLEDGHIFISLPRGRPAT